MAREVHTPIFNNRTFAFEQPALQFCVGFPYQQFSSRADYAMPRNPAPLRAGSHGVTCSTRPAAQSQRARQLPVRRDAPARDLLHQPVDRFPRHFFDRRSSLLPASSERKSGLAPTWRRATLVQQRRPTSHLTFQKCCCIYPALCAPTVAPTDAFCEVRCFQSSASEPLSRSPLQVITDTKQPGQSRSILPLTA
jgi:hypothetical protein